jgi:hypothetical protein
VWYLPARFGAFFGGGMAQMDSDCCYRAHFDMTVFFVLVEGRFVALARRGQMLFYERQAWLSAFF